MKFIVVGGGTAGWLSALYCKRMHPESSVTVIESEEIGILGAGEGTVPGVVDLIQFLGISVLDLIKNCDATIKNGIKFTNWSSQDFYYTFKPMGDLAIDSVKPASNFTGTNSLDLLLFDFYQNNSFKRIDWVGRLSEKNMVPFNKPPTDINGSRSISDFAVHFNARKLAEFLKKVAISRGVNHVDAIVQKINTDSDGFIQSLSCNNNTNYDCDFVFDCSGFKRLIIGSFYKTKWISYKEHLPMNSAIAFFLKNKDEIKPYTEAVAMDYGWMWNIPTQTRIGAGYVFNNEYISKDEAKDEIDKYFNTDVEIINTFNFEAGYYEKSWINNCAAIGLSSGFVEPLEATSLLGTARYLKKILSNRNFVKNINKYNIDLYNNFFIESNKEIIDFIYIHYLTDKKNNDFWKNYKEKYRPTLGVEVLLDKCKKNIISYDDINNVSMFGLYGYIAILMGIGYIDKSTIQQEMLYNGLFTSEFISMYSNYLEKTSSLENICITHNDFLGVQ